MVQDYKVVFIVEADALCEVFGCGGKRFSRETIDGERRLVCRKCGTVQDADLCGMGYDDDSAETVRKVVRPVD